MPDHQQSAVLLDDGQFQVVLDGQRTPDIAGGILQRRCLASLATPKGVAAVGAFELAADGSWLAHIASLYDARTGERSQIIGRGLQRLDAVVALWQVRHQALFHHCSL